MSKKTWSECIVFVGPTLQGIDKRLINDNNVIIRPPVRRGDIERMVKESHPANIAIVDGTFHAHPAVGHAEILEALHAGWKIWGLSSMGAIRACEMDQLGLIGFGQVYQQFSSDPDMTDDEVTLLHQADAPYLPVSEPLIHIRQLLAEFETQQKITTIQQQQILRDFKSLWFGHRTLYRLSQRLAEIAVPGNEIDEALKDFGRYRIKSSDLVDFLKQQPWKSTVRNNDTIRNNA
ncbi:TfuA-like protein [Pseudomonas sp. RIT-To-2]|uniref:TfuA-like protein n=1 Tax=Pseudomonas sp. RIT-To-2 TaxID=3462541 RepID=UPI002413567C